MSDELALLINAGNPLIVIETIDEESAASLVKQVAKDLSRPMYDWSMTTGLRPIKNGKLGQPVADPGKAQLTLQQIHDARYERTIFLMRDFGPHAKDAQVHRQLRDLTQRFDKSKSVFVLVDALPLPNELKRFTIRYELGWPSVEALRNVVKRTYKRISKERCEEVSARLTKQDLEVLVQTLRGLSEKQAERVVASAFYDDFALTADDLPGIIEAKRTLLGTTGCLESIAADFSSDDIGGLANLKAWLMVRRGGFTNAARKFGIAPPRGVLMLGVPGCGKSLCAKVVAADWKMPLLRLDPGVLYQKFVGETESRLRDALAQAESMAPVILWIDEIEKAFASAGAQSADGGLSQRMFGTLLSWMQDHRHPIFIIATANDISALPPELMRKGRFDEVFFVDLPDAEARAHILAIHLRRCHRNPRDFDLNKLAKAAEQFSGGELEQVIQSSLFAAFCAKSELKDKHIHQEIGKTRPLAILNSEKITALRDWAHDRCVFAD